MPPKTIGFIEDLHIGSHYAPWPEEDLPADVNKFEKSRYTVKCLNHMSEMLPHMNILYLVGDVIEGDNRKSQATGLHTAKLGDQVEAAITLLAPIVEKADVVIRIEGTPYHEGFQGAMNAFDKRFKVRETTQVHDLIVEGKNNLNVAHHPSGGATIYKGTSLDRENIWQSYAVAAGKVCPARWIVRAHHHYWARFETSFKTVIQTPCFKLPDPYSKKQNYWRFQPDLGGVVMYRDELQPGNYSFRPILYDVPIPQPRNWETYTE